jgi:hypothetical protein
MIDRITGMGALRSAPQLRERLLRRIGSWSWNDEVGSIAVDGRADANGRFGAPLVQSRRSAFVKSFGC